MKLHLVAIAGVMTAGAAIAGEDRDAPLPDLGHEREGEVRLLDPDRNCQETIQTVRAERGLPRVERTPSDGEEAILYKAVDHEIDGCDVLLVGDGDIRPVPVPDEDQPLLKPAQ